MKSDVKSRAIEVAPSKFKCPSCNKNLGSGIFLGHDINFCPFCGQELWW